jgi:hypothetical protein
MPAFTRLKLIAKIRIAATICFFIGALLAYRSSMNEIGQAQPLLPAFFFIVSLGLAFSSQKFGAKDDK